LRQPHGGQILVLVVERADLPPPPAGAMGDNAVPPQGDEHMRRPVEDALLELPHEAPRYLLALYERRHSTRTALFRMSSEIVICKRSAVVLLIISVGSFVISIGIL
jgi:hypothetical protein